MLSLGNKRMRDQWRKFCKAELGHVLPLNCYDMSDEGDLLIGHKVEKGDPPIWLKNGKACWILLTAYEADPAELEED